MPSYYRDVPAHGTEKILKPSEVLAGSKGVGEGEERYAAHRFLVDGATEKARAERAIEDANAQDPLVDGLQPDEDEERVEDGRWRHEQVQRLKARVKVGRLPDSDLLKAVHAFAGLFYEACGSHFDFRSLDETALLACGVLLEETVRDELGESGDLVFLEGAEDGASRVRKDESSGEVEEASTTRKHRKQKRDEGDSSPATQNDTEQEEQTGKRGKKRRKLDEDAQSRFGEEW